MSGQLFSGNKIQQILNGEFIDGDIRFNDQIRDAIEEINQLLKGTGSSRANENDKKRWLQRYVDVA